MNINLYDFWYHTHEILLVNKNLNKFTPREEKETNNFIFYKPTENEEEKNV